MSSRATQKDTEADRKLYACLNASPPKSFLMIAGAGSGKTTSLIKGLSEILNRHGDKLKQRRQRVACITYTDIAAREIWADVGNNSLVHVSTIHSFLWIVSRSFQADIHAWVAHRIAEKLEKLRQTAAAFGPRVQQRTRDKNRKDIARHEQLKTRIGRIRSFSYGTGSDYAKGILGHNDIIKMVPQIISERPLMRSLLAQQYPFLFVDESQDTMHDVVAALKAVDQQMGMQFCLGFFGDPMQQIYMTGVGNISPEEGWESITKDENFRCPTSVLKVANAIRREGDRIVQTRGRTLERDGEQISFPGSSNCIIFPIDNRRDERVADVRAWASTKTGDPLWLSTEDSKAIKVLVIVHRMAAKRLGFADLYSALNDKAPESFKSGFLDGTAWPLRPFIKFVLPLVEAANGLQEFQVMNILRTQSPLLYTENLAGVNVANRLLELRHLTEALQRMLKSEAIATNADVLHLLNQTKVIDLDPKILSYLDLPPVGKADPDEQDESGEQDEEELTNEIAAMDAFLACPASQFRGYFRYVNSDSPFATQQGIKGAEFERVLVLLDDDEGTHTQFSYDKYLGLKPLSERDEQNVREGKETTIDRTRRLFYVSCTRAMKDLIVVLFTGDVRAARRQIIELGLFPEESVLLEEDIIQSW